MTSSQLAEHLAMQVASRLKICQLAVWRPRNLAALQQPSTSLLCNAHALTAANMRQSQLLGALQNSSGSLMEAIPLCPDLLPLPSGGLHSG